MCRRRIRSGSSSCSTLLRLQSSLSRRGSLVRLAPLVRLVYLLFAIKRAVDDIDSAELFPKLGCGGLAEGDEGRKVGWSISLPLAELVQPMIDVGHALYDIVRICHLALRSLLLQALILREVQLFIVNLPEVPWQEPPDDVGGGREAGRGRREQGLLLVEQQRQV